MPASHSIIDMHTHIMPPEWEDIGSRFGIDEWLWVSRESSTKSTIMKGERKFRVITDQSFSPERHIADMDAEGIGRHLLQPIPVMFCYREPPEATAEFARIHNDFIAQTVSDYPDRFLAAATVAMQSPPFAITELERVKKLGFCAVEIGTNIAGKDLDDPSVFEILEAAEALDLAIVLHPWDSIGSERMRDFYLPHMVGFPADISLAAARLIFGGVLDRLPKLRIGLPHGGGSFPTLLGRIDHGYTVRAEAKKFHCKSPSSYLNRFYIDFNTHDSLMLEFLCKKFGSKRVMLGSDYPFDMGLAHPLEHLSSARLSDEERDDIMFHSAEEFLGLSS